MIPTARTPYRDAACRAIPPHPQPTSNSRIPGRSASLRATSSYFAACASSRVMPGCSHTAQEYVIEGPSTML